MSHNNFKNAISVATILAISACLVPESAQAGKVKASGNSKQVTNVYFEIDDSVGDTLPNNNNKGVFPKAIQEFDFVVSILGRPSPFNPWFCGAKNNELCQGNLTVTKSETGIKYEVNFDNRIEPETKEVIKTGSLEWNIPKDSSLINVNDFNVNNLSSLSQLEVSRQFEYTNIAEGKYYLPTDKPTSIVGVDPASLNTFLIYPDTSFTFSLQQPQPVPEPSDTAGFIVVSGALGAVSLLKRHKRLKKLV